MFLCEDRFRKSFSLVKYIIEINRWCPVGLLKPRATAVLPLLSREDLRTLTCVHVVLTLSAEIIYHERSWNGAVARKLCENNFVFKSF